MNEEELHKRLLDTFNLEMDEHLQVMAEIISELNANCNEPERLNELFRAAHSLKGAARSVGYSEIEDTCHKFESQLAKIRESEEPISDSDISAAFKNLTKLKSFREESSEKEEMALPSDNNETSFHSQTSKVNQTESAKGTRVASESIRVPSAILDRLLTNTSELKIAASEGDALAADLAHIEKSLFSLPELNSDEVRTPIKEVQEIINSVKSRTKKMLSELHRHLEVLEDTVLQSRLKPFSAACDPVQAFLNAEGKNINFVKVGAELKLDRFVVERLTTILMHLARNSVDHGFEAMLDEEKTEAPQTGNILVDLSREGNNIKLTYSDDGKGIDRERLKQSLQQHGYAIPEQSDVELELLFEPDISTRASVSKVSGRGVGLNAVQSIVSELRGTVTVSSEQGNGVRFVVTIPQYVASFDALIVRQGDTDFAIDSNFIESTCSISASDFEDNCYDNLIEIDGETYPVIGLPPLFSGKELSPGAAVIVLNDARKYVILVNQLIGLESVVARSISQQVGSVPGISGAAIRGGREVALLLDVGYVTKTTMGNYSGQFYPVKNNERTQHPATILVAEDSITTRVLEVTILKEAGYNVIAAEDGEKAWELLCKNTVDAVVSDIDMPSINGFELTRKIRTADTLKDLPIILLTARETPADKVKGLDVGANYYIEKGRFDQSGLLDIIKSLLGT
jgi:two-component system, chemotaxis family, sensor kinase CheA